MVNRMKRTLAALALAVVSTTTFAGTAHAAPSANDRAALTQKPAAVAKGFLVAVEDGNGAKACSLMTKKFAADSISSFVEAGIIKEGGTCADAIEEISGVIGEMGGYGTIKAKTISVKGKTAKVQVTSPEIEMKSVFIVVKVGKKWLLNGEIA